jgi:hypothetical protein
MITILPNQQPKLYAHVAANDLKKIKSPFDELRL